jgi:hypothetical protein
MIRLKWRAPDEDPIVVDPLPPRQVHREGTLELHSEEGLVSGFGRCRRGQGRDPAAARGRSWRSILTRS